MSNMTPSETITAGQIAKITDRITARLRKLGLSSEAVQIVIEDKESDVVDEMVKPFVARVEMISDVIVHRVQVNRTRTNRQALEATGRKLYVDNDVVDSIPVGEGDEVTLVYFKPQAWEYTMPGLMSDDDLEGCLQRRGLTSDPRAVAADNEQNHEFSDTHPHGTHWQDADGDWCFAHWSRWNHERRVHVRRNGSDWSDYWWFVGSRSSQV